MRVVRRTLGCGVVGIGLVAGLGGLIGAAPRPDQPGGSLVSAVIGLAILAISFGLLRWMQLADESEAARRSEQPGPTAASRIRSYGGPWDDVLPSFERDARALAAKGYLAKSERWEPMARSHPRLFAAIRMVEVLAAMVFRGRGAFDFVSRRGTLVVTYGIGSSTDEALARIDRALVRLRSSGPM